MEEEKEKKEKENYKVGVINRNRIRKHAGGFNVSEEYIDKLEEEVKRLIKNSIIRATGNRRATLLRRDV